MPIVVHIKCTNCGHYGMIEKDAFDEKVGRAGSRNLVCSRCGAKGATEQHIGWHGRVNVQIDYPED